jgi:hypothetical protein
VDLPSESTYRNDQDSYGDASGYSDYGQPDDRFRPGYQMRGSGDQGRPSEVVEPEYWPTPAAFRDQPYQQDSRPEQDDVPTQRPQWNGPSKSQKGIERDWD